MTSFDRLLDLQIAAGVDGFVPLGTTGESPTLSSDERRQILKATVDKARKHGKRVLAGCGSNDTGKAVLLTREAEEMGCDGALIITPYYNKPTQEGLVAHFSKIADETQLPIVLYHAPGRAGVGFTLETLQKLFAHPRIVGIKEASGNHALWMQMAEQFSKTEKCLLSGDDDMMATFCAMGGCGIISASANVVPKGFVRIWNAARSGDTAAAFEAQIAILPVVRAMFAETNPMPVKYALSKMGIGSNKLRLPLVAVKPATEKVIDAAMELMRSRDLL